MGILDKKKKKTTSQERINKEKLIYEISSGMTTEQSIPPRQAPDEVYRVQQSKSCDYDN